MEKFNVNQIYTSLKKQKIWTIFFSLNKNRKDLHHFSLLTKTEKEKKIGETNWTSHRLWPIAATGKQGNPI
jgi:hypothetical protein